MLPRDIGPLHPHHVGARLARARRRRRWRLGAAGQSQPVHLADHGVARDAAQFAGDLAGGKPVRPELLEQFDPLVGPRHELSSPVRKCRCRWQNPPSQPGDRPNWDHSRSQNTGNCSPRHVVLNGGDATIWRDSGARVGRDFTSTFSCYLRAVNPQGTASTVAFRVTAGRAVSTRNTAVLTPSGPEIR